MMIGKSQELRDGGTAAGERVGKCLRIADGAQRDDLAPGHIGQPGAADRQAAHAAGAAHSAGGPACSRGS